MVHIVSEDIKYNLHNFLLLDSGGIEALSEAQYGVPREVQEEKHRDMHEERH